MPVITIREQQKTDSGFEAILSFDGEVEYPVTIADPFTHKQEQLLEWYFEEWLVFPFTDTVKAEQVARSIKIYGEHLFKQVFQTNINVYSQYQQLRPQLSQLQVEIVSKTPEFQGLHWEAMRDPNLPRPLAIDCVVVRKSIKPAPVSAYVQPSPVINLLVVVARPDEEDDVGYRTISRPLIEAIQNSQLGVNVELLRPGTYEALDRHLEEKGEGFYHIIHFDAHGALRTYQELQSGSEANRYAYQVRYGRLDLQPYNGVKAFLFLEGETKGKADPVEAKELANLLTGKGIPVCILNACQSGKQIQSPLASIESVGTEDEDYRETSLGSRLMMAGTQMVVAMGYSVTVSAAALLMKQVYTNLFDKKDFTQALRLGRRELYNRKERQAYYRQTIDLEDWLLPVVYKNKAVDLNLREFTPEEEEKFFESLGSQYRFTPPTYGFIGRDLEILKIEKALLRHNLLLLQGMGGTGKTTLLSYLREWWQTTHFARQVFYFGYDEKAWTLEQLLFEIGKQVYNRFEQAQFQAMNLAAQVQKLVAKLRAESYILILDNLESVTGQQLAIQNTLPEAERNSLRDFLARLVGGKTCVVLGSRSGEEWLKNQTFQTNIYQLQGLDKEARSVLAEKILERHVVAHQIPKIRQDTGFIWLMQVLAGYPLAMEVVLANLKHQSPAEILAGLQAADVNLDVPSENKTKSILKCVEYSHSNLSTDAQSLLLFLAPFSGFIDQDEIPNYVEQMQKLEQFKDYPFDKFDTAIQEAINWGLLSPDSDYPPWLTIQPVFPYFLKTKLDSLNKAIHFALQEGFKNHYQDLAYYYQQLMESKEAEKKKMAQVLCKLDYVNLYNALNICLENKESVSIFFCLNKYFKLINDKQNNLKLAEMVYQTTEKYPSTFKSSELGYQIRFVLHHTANCYLETKHYGLAKQLYQKALKNYQTIKSVEEREKQVNIAAIYHQLGRVAQQLREWEQARQHYQQALEIKIEYGERYEQAVTYYNLGMVAEALEELEEAKTNYLQALQLDVEFNNQDSLDISLRNLARFYQATQDESLLTAVASILRVTVEEIKEKLLSNGDS